MLILKYLNFRILWYFRKDIEAAEPRERLSFPSTAEVAMSQEHVHVVRGMSAACAKGDVSTLMAALDPPVPWWKAENLLYTDGNPDIGPPAGLEGVFERIGQE